MHAISKLIETHNKKDCSESTGQYDIDRIINMLPEDHTTKWIELKFRVWSMKSHVKINFEAACFSSSFFYE
jgi:hypothetical protein